MFTLYWRTFPVATKSYPIQYEQQRRGAAQVVHTHRISCQPGRLAETVWCTKFQVLPPEYLLPSQWVPGLAPIYVFLPRAEQVFTLQQTIARDWRGAASLRYRNLAEITVLMCEQKPLSGMVFVPAQKLSSIVHGHSPSRNSQRPRRRRRQRRRRQRQRQISKTTILHVQHTFLVHFFAVTVRPRREFSLFDLLWRS